jgi:hypothetical protein
LARVTHVCNKEAEIATLQTDVKYIREKVDSLHAKVVGNGENGLIDEMNQMKGGLSTFKWLYGAAIGMIALFVAIWK